MISVRLPCSWKGARRCSVPAHCTLLGEKGRHGVSGGVHTRAKNMHRSDEDLKVPRATRHDQERSQRKCVLDANGYTHWPHVFSSVMNNRTCCYCWDCRCSLLCAYFAHNEINLKDQETSIPKLQAKELSKTTVTACKGCRVPFVCETGSGLQWGLLPLLRTRLYPPDLSGSDWGCCLSTGTPGGMGCPLCQCCPVSAGGLPSWNCPCFHPRKARHDF